jgi:hypothetical protein
MAYFIKKNHYLQKTNYYMISAMIITNFIEKLEARKARSLKDRIKIWQKAK